MRQLINRVTVDKLTEIERLENEFLEVANKVAKMNATEAEQQKTTTEEGSVKKVDNNKNKEYSINKELGGTEDGNVINRQRYSETRNESNTIDNRRFATRKESWKENQSDFIRRTKKSGKEIVELKNSTVLFAYTPAQADSSFAYKAVAFLNYLGIKTIYCEGLMESNNGFTTQTHPEAATGPDGTVYINKNSSISVISVAVHEASHHFEKKHTTEYNELKNAIINHLNTESKAYNDFVCEIKKNYYNNVKITEENIIKLSKTVTSELVSYTNQYISTDYNKALKHFAPMFYNWEAVVKASKKFNEDIGLSALIESSNIKLSLPTIDSDGNKLSKEQREYFKDSKVLDNNGNLMVMYQGSAEEFYEFDRKKSSPFNLYGRGFYFTNSKSHAGQYGNVLREYYLNITNPISTYKGDSVFTKKQLKKFLEVVAENEDYSIENYGTYDIDKIVDSVYGKSDYAMLQDISATAIGDLVETIELFNKVIGTSYDGLILNSETIIFNSNQAKLTSNKTPTEDADIRYSLPENPTPEQIGQALYDHEISMEA